MIGHLASQGPVIAALVRAAMRKPATGELVVPGKIRTQSLPARPKSLVDDAIRWAGGTPSAYAGNVPPWLFPQWTFPLLCESLSDMPYDLVRAMNGGCRLEIGAPISGRSALELTGQVVNVDDDGKRAIFSTRLTTGTAESPDALVATMQAFLPLQKSEARSKAKPTVPADARPIARRKFTAADARAFAILTGDVNPLHWIGPYARAAGFPNTILHGFGTLAFAMESLNKGVFAGDVTKLRSVDIRFTRPLVLPHTVQVFVGAGDTFHVGDAPGGPAFLSGTFTHR